MRIRGLAFVALVATGLAPLGFYAAASIQRSERTAAAAIRSGNERLARSAADRIAAYAEAEVALLEAIGSAASFAEGRAELEAVLDSYALAQPHLHELTVFDAAGVVRGGAGLEVAPALLGRALSGVAAAGSVAPADAAAGGAFAHTQLVVVPISVAGVRRGAIAARVDLIYVWKPISRIQVGERGFARLIDVDGTLLAHGDPEERRYVFAGARERDDAIVAGALLREVVPNLQGEPVIAAMALVPGRPWAVIVEQPVAEAFAAARAMTRDLAYFGLAALVLALGVGVGLGRGVVRSLEQLRAHTRVLAAGDLEARVEPASRVTEVRALAISLNEMADSLRELHERARARDRLATFARVAAGLAHDLRQPIEAVRTSCAQLIEAPEDDAARELFRWVSDKELPRLKRYVDDLQRIANEGEVKLDFEELSPRELADEVVADLRANPKWRGVEFVARGAATALVGDRGLLRRALFNLAANGADACVARGGGEVAIEVGDVGDAAACELRVVDTGGGLEAAALAKLVSGDFHSTKRSSGVGLGFGVARHVARAHGGAIVADSEPGRGSRFALRVPRRSEPHDVDLDAITGGRESVSEAATARPSP